MPFNFSQKLWEIKNECLEIYNKNWREKSTLEVFSIQMLDTHFHLILSFAGIEVECRMVECGVALEGRSHGPAFGLELERSELLGHAA